MDQDFEHFLESLRGMLPTPEEFLEQLWTKPRNKAVDLALEIMETCSYGEHLELLSEPELVIYSARVLEDEVNNGGFAQFFFNSGGNVSNFLVEAFTQLGAPKTAEICGRAVAVFGQTVPTDWDERNAVISALADKDAAIWETCDCEFFQTGEDLIALAEAYIAAHAEAFAAYLENGV